MPERYLIANWKMNFPPAGIGSYCDDLRSASSADPQLVVAPPFVVLAAVVVSWLPIDRRNPLVMLVTRLTEPALAPIRRALPPMGGLDLSPMVLLIALQLLKRVLTAA